MKLTKYPAYFVAFFSFLKKYFCFQNIPFFKSRVDTFLIARILF